MKYTVIYLDAAQRASIKAADVRKWPAGWALTYICERPAGSLYVEGYGDGDVLTGDYKIVARDLRGKDCLAATLAYPEVAR